MIIKYKDVRFRAETLELIHDCNAIIGYYQAQGLRMTLRQLYYQLVARNIIVNSQRSYKNLGRAVSEGRLAGMIRWDAIEDRTRQPYSPFAWGDGVTSFAEWAADQYRLDRGMGQEFYVEVWVEKESLYNVLIPVTREYDVTLGVNKGYSSQSAMWEAAERFIEQGKEKDCILLYLGDQDPSGENMVENISYRLNDLFMATVEVHKIAITPEQVAQYDPPTNPVKMTDSRAMKFLAEFGNAAYEVDALDIAVLQQVVRDSVEPYIDFTAREQVIEMEKVHQQALRDAAPAAEEHLHRLTGGE